MIIDFMRGCTKGPWPMPALGAPQKTNIDIMLVNPVHTQQHHKHYTYWLTNNYA